MRVQVGKSGCYKAKMPKRDDAYMSAQRDGIARAAMTCLLEKGLHDTSLRDVCKEAGISIGALYTHFSTLEEVFVAGALLDCGPPRAAAATWDDYVAQLRAVKGEFWDQGRMRRFRLSLQFIATMTERRANPPGLSELYARDLLWLRSSLEAMSKAGEIELPLGLELTITTHRRLLVGTLHVAVADRDQHFDDAVEEMIAAIALTVGRKVAKEAPGPIGAKKAGASKPASRNSKQRRA